MLDCRCTNENPAWSEIAQLLSENASHAPSPSKQLITLTQILESALKIYHMDVVCGFLKPSHESMEVNPAQPNIIAGSLHIAVLSPNKIPAQDILKISAP